MAGHPQGPIRRDPYFWDTVLDDRIREGHLTWAPSARVTVVGTRLHEQDLFSALGIPEHLLGSAKESPK